MSASSLPEGRADGRIRLSDAEREAVAAFLRDQAGEGRLTLLELEERLEAAYGARYRSDLDGLTDDLPTPAEVRPAPVARPEPETRPARPRRSDRSCAAPGSFEAHLRIYLVFCAFFTAIYVITDFGGYFWPVWPALGWGVGVASHWASARR